MTGIEDDGLDLLRIMNSAGTQNWLDDLADIHDRDQVLVAAAQKRKVRKKTNTVDRKLTRSRLGTDDAALAPERNSPADALVFRKLIELRDVRESHIRAIPLPDDRPVAGPHNCAGQSERALQFCDRWSMLSHRSPR